MVAADYPFLDILWTMVVIFAWIIWFWLLITVFSDIFRRRDTSGFKRRSEDRPPRRCLGHRDERPLCFLGAVAPGTRRIGLAIGPARRRDRDGSSRCWETSLARLRALPWVAEVYPRGRPEDRPGCHRSRCHDGQNARSGAGVRLAVVAWFAGHRNRPPFEGVLDHRSTGKVSMPAPILQNPSVRRGRSRSRGRGSAVIGSPPVSSYGHARNLHRSARRRGKSCAGAHRKKRGAESAQSRGDFD